MSATTSPAAKPAYHYVVISPFLVYAKGEIVTDTAAIATIEKDYLPHVVRVAAA